MQQQQESGMKEKKEYVTEVDVLYPVAQEDPNIKVPLT